MQEEEEGGEPSAAVHEGEKLGRRTQKTRWSFDDLSQPRPRPPPLSLSLFPPQVLRPKIALLKNEAGLADPAKLGAVLSAQPRALLASSLDRHLKPTVTFFTAKSGDGDATKGLGMRKSTLARIAAERPVLLTYDAGEQLLPKVKFFAELGLSAAQIRRMVAASPDVLSIGIGNDLMPTVSWIRSIGIDGRDLAGLLAHHPTIFHNPLHVAKENVKLLKGSGGGGGGGAGGGAGGVPADSPWRASGVCVPYSQPAPPAPASSSGNAGGLRISGK